MPCNKINKRSNSTETNGLHGLSNVSKFTNYPTDVLEFIGERGLHPTQKPVALMEYLIKTYTNEGETVLDFTMGSGTTGVAAKNLDRNFIGIELDETYFNIAKLRISEA
jgi:site-specific DNA-methyltransferase (adenine-specific)